MADAPTRPESPDVAPRADIDEGTYEIIRKRLAAQGSELRRRLEQLDAARREAFGAVELAVLGTERIATRNNCVPRDMVAIGGRFIFAYNVHFGLSTERGIGDVFSVYSYEDGAFHEQPLTLIEDARFVEDFRELYKYYKHTAFAKFAVIGPHLFMKFHVGKSVDDFKTFKWAIEGDRLIYLDNRSEHEFRYPAQHEFEWRRAHRDMQYSGPHPHVSIEDRVFVETVGGDLTVKIENNTESGEGIYSEPVDDPDQTLDDADYFYAVVGNLVIMKIRPYQEQAYRYLVYNDRIQRVSRIDAIGHACVQLPNDQGIIFANGYYLQNGDSKLFDSQLTGMIYEKRVASPNGEDFLYVFYNRRQGVYILLPYNIIRQNIETPIVCNGYSLFNDGRMICFKTTDEPRKLHAVQIWQTPYVGEDHAPSVSGVSYLARIGNRDLVQGMSECYELLALLAKGESYANLYVDLTRKTQDIIDAHFWIGREETFNLAQPLSTIKGAAATAIGEFEKVRAIRRDTRERVEAAEREARELLREAGAARFASIDDFVRLLAGLRGLRGKVISLRELKYVDADRVEQMETAVAEQTTALARRCVSFLLEPDALAPYSAKVDGQEARIEGLEKVSAARKLEEQVLASSGELEMLIEIVSNLPIEDATQRTEIIDNISAVFARLNAVRSRLKGHMQELASVEGRAEFNAQMKLIGQSVVNYLDLCDTPDKCDEYLSKLMVQLEELEGTFAEFDAFVVQLAEKREEIYHAFEQRKLALVEARNRRAATLERAADRILTGIRTRVDALDSIEAIHGYFAADLMIDKVRDIVGQLEQLGDSVKVDDIQSRLKTIREDAVRQLKDRQDLFVDGANVIRLGEHSFSVNRQALDLTTVLREDELYLHLTGTGYFERIDDEALLAMRDAWEQEAVSENDEVYRAEYLAWLMFQRIGDELPDRTTLLTMPEPERVALVQRFMAPRYAEGYVKGVHDHDAAMILRALLELRDRIGLLRFTTEARALAWLFWERLDDAAQKKLLGARLEGYGAVVEAFPDAARGNGNAGADGAASYVLPLRAGLAAFVEATGLFAAELVDEAAEYLFHELLEPGPFATSRVAVELHEGFLGHMRAQGREPRLNASREALADDPLACYALERDWVASYLEAHGERGRAEYAAEVATLLHGGGTAGRTVIDAGVLCDLEGLQGNHPRIEKGRYHLNYNRFLRRLGHFGEVTVPRFEACVARKHEVIEAARESMRLGEFKPRVLSSFVRNRLINDVYLPLIGSNLAKQIGVVGENKRTDLMGLLLLISPPGYGKTTLMEYTANRLGLIFMKINGPAIGHRVTSLDPAEAPNASAREELHKLNLALEMGDNVMLYVDDIQHCNAEFLQKFISLCDAQRKIEGVWRGRPRTYDLRGKKVCVVMAGNPYTESGEKFRIPDMLANRADTYNLGEIIGDNRESFELSFLENSLTSNPVLNNLAGRSQRDVYAAIRIAETGSREGVDFEGRFTGQEIDDMVATMKKLMVVRDVVLRMNRQYIASAAQADEYRTEPPFKLQGSYRNMNRMAEQVRPIMNDDELWTVIHAHYENEAQTLTTGTEANLLKYREMLGLMNEDQRERWEEIKRGFKRNLLLGAAGGEDRFAQVILQLTQFNEGLEALRKTVERGAEASARGDGRPVHAAFDEHSAALLRELMTRMGEARPGDAPPIEIKNTVPRVILNVLRHQFKLMQEWLQPIMVQTARQGDHLERLTEAIQEHYGHYSKLIDAMERAAKKRDTDIDTDDRNITGGA